MADTLAPEKVSDLRTGSGGDLASTLSDTSRVVNEAASYVQNAATMVGQISTNPTGWLTSVGLGFLISLIEPLQDAVHMVSGDGRALRQASTEYDGTGRELESMTRELVDLADRALAEWRGEAAHAAKRFLAAAADDLEESALKSAAMAEILELSAMVMDVVEDVVKSLLSKFVNWLVLTWLPALASAATTFGASTAAAGSATTVQLVTTTTETTQQIKKVCDLLDTIAEVLPKLGYDQLGSQVAQPSEVGKTKVDAEGGSTTLFKNKWESKALPKDLTGESKGTLGPIEGSGKFEVKGPGIAHEHELSLGSKGLKSEVKTEVYLVKGETEDKVTLGPAELKAKAEAAVLAEGKIGATANTTEGLDVGGDLFAGAKAGIDGSVDLGGIGIGYKAEEWAGAGITAHVKAGMENGRYVVGGEYGEALPFGGKAGVYVSVDPAKVVQTASGIADSVENGVRSAVDTATEWVVPQSIRWN
jgi:hypothetical protein